MFVGVRGRFLGASRTGREALGAASCRIATAASVTRHSERSASAGPDPSAQSQTPATNRDFLPSNAPVGTFIRELRYALRQFWAARVFTATAVLTLALGIGGTTAIFTLIHAVMLRSLPVGDPSRLYRIGDGDSCCVQGGPQDRWGMFSYPLFERLKAETPEFEELTAFQAGGARVSVRRQGVDATPRPLRSEYVTGNYFSTLGVSAFARPRVHRRRRHAGGAARRRPQLSRCGRAPTAAIRRSSAPRSSSRDTRSPSPGSRRRDSSARRSAPTRPTCGFRSSRNR